MIKKIVIALTLVGCGATDVDFKAPPEVKLNDYLGERANTARRYVSDRNISGEDFQNFTNTVAEQTDDGYVSTRDKVDSGYVSNRDKLDTGYVSNRDKVDSGYVNGKEAVSAAKHKAAGYTGDRNITGDAFSKQFDDYEGKVRRKGEITKGYTTDRLNAMRDPNRDERNEITDLKDRADTSEGRLDSAEARLEAEEAQSAAQSVLISQLELEAELRAILVDGEFRDVDSDMDSLRSDMEQADMELMDALNTAKGEIEVAMAAMLEDLNQADADQDQALTVELAQLRVEIGQAEQAAKLYADDQDDILESELRSKIRRVKRRLRYKIRRLESRMSSRLRSAVHNLEHRISRAERSAKAYADRQDGALRSSLVAMIDGLQLDVDTNQAASELADQLLRSYVDSENGRQDTALASAVSTLELYIDYENSYQNGVAYQVLLLAKGYIDGADLALSNRIDDLQTDLDAQNTSLLQAIDDAEQAANAYADANDSDTVYDDTQVQADIESISGAGGSIEVLTALIQANSDAIAALESNPDLVCSVTISTVAISERYKYYHGGGGHYHWSTRTRVLSIPTVTCPSPLASDDE